MYLFIRHIAKYFNGGKTIGNSVRNFQKTRERIKKKTGRDKHQKKINYLLIHILIILLYIYIYFYHTGNNQSFIFVACPTLLISFFKVSCIIFGVRIFFFQPITMWLTNEQLGPVLNHHFFTTKYTDSTLNYIYTLQ